MHPRYFIGITLPDELSQTINEIQQELYVPHHVMQPLRPHITLLHPGMLETIAPMSFIPKAKKAAEENLPAKIQLTGTAMFDRRVLYIAIKSPGIEKLYTKLVSLLPDRVCAQHTVGKKFAAHATLAQAKPKQTLEPDFVTKFKERISPLLPQTYTATHLTQFKWLRPSSYQIKQI